MRALLVACVVASPALALAEAKPPVVWKNRVIAEPASALTTVSHKLYLNDCRPNGCVVSPGNDDSLTNRSSIPDSQVTLDAYTHGDAHWQRLVDCVRDTFKPFDIEIVTEDPGSASHFEVMIGGTSRQLDPTLDAGGVAPFISCGATRNNIISFVFAGGSSSINFLCGAVAQEASHVWGLDHELDALDPMTYLDLGSSKRFQNSDPSCGEDTPRRCRCGGTTQNSFRYMNTTFGLNPAIGDATLAITSPREGEWVLPNFAINATLTSELDMIRGTLAIDGSEIEQATANVLAFNAPDLAPGQHAIEISATDAGDRSLSQTVNVNVIGACVSGSCPSGLHCLGGSCLPGANEEGGLGAQCTESSDCITNSCASDGSESLCTGTCDPGGSCPSGFDCLDVNVCWPSASGGCATGGGSGFAFAGLGVLALVLRRRRA